MSSATASLAMLAIAAAGPAAIQSAFDRLSADGSANVDAQGIQYTAALLALIFGLVAGGLFRFRIPVSNWLAALAADVREEAGAQWTLTRDAFGQTSRLHRFSLAAIFAAAVGIRFAHLWAPMRYDESYTFNSYVSQSFSRILVEYWPNNHMLHSLLAHVCTLVLGDAPWVIRLPAFVAGALLIPAAYLLFARYGNAEAGLIAAALTAVSPPLVAYSVNARGYTLIALLFLALALVTLELQQRSDRSLWTFFVLLSAAGLFTIPTMLFGIALCAVSLVSFRVLHAPSARFFVQMGLAFGCIGALTAALYSPSILVSGLDAILNNRFVEAVPWSEMPAQWQANAAFILEAWHSGWPLPFSAAVWACAAVGLAAVFLRFPWPRTAYLLFGILGCVLLVLAKRVVPVQRVWLFLAPLYLGVAAIGASFLLRKLSAARSAALVPAAALVVCLAGGVTLVSSRSVYRSVETGGAPDSERIANVLRGSLRPGDRLVVSALYSHSVWYYVRRAIGSTFDSGPEEPAGRVFVVLDSAEQRSLDELLRARGVDGAGFVEHRKLWQSAGAEILELHRKPAAADPI